MRCCLLRLARRLCCEVRSLLVDAATAWRSGRRPWLAVLASAVTIAVAGAWHQPAHRQVLLDLGGAYARQPLDTELARVPASVFFPTWDLPWWGAVAQIAVVLGIAEILIGRTGVTIVAGLAQFASTLAARVMIIYSGVAYLGLPFSQAGVLDTGPSSVTTAIGVWLLCRRRAYAAVGLVAVALTVAAVLQRNIDGREHETAMLAGLLVAAAQAHLGRWWRRRRVHETSTGCGPSTATR